VVGVVVLGPERLQAEAWTAETHRDNIIIRDERVDHVASVHMAVRGPWPTHAVPL
jgi:hypothetical protein